MEIRSKFPAWLNKNHPNFLRWERARNLSLDRGKFVNKIINTITEPKNLTVLDLGSGEGGTSRIFSNKNFVISYDLSKIRLIRQRQNYQINQLICGDAVKLPFGDAIFDLVILKDVFEHIDNQMALVSEVKRTLKNDGIIYLSTPNRFSILNALSDPHWGFPIVSVLKRKTIRNIFLKYFRKSEVNRNDLAELLSLNQIIKYFSPEFEVRIQTNKVLEELFNGNSGIVWSNFHLSLIRILKRLSIHKLLIRISNDNFGILNKYFTPTFYLVMKRKSN
ncbi:MAG: class I SAM-dependent methyltransferase [Ignavibacterium sp.]